MCLRNYSIVWLTLQSEGKWSQVRIPRAGRSCLSRFDPVILLASSKPEKETQPFNPPPSPSWSALGWPPRGQRSLQSAAWSPLPPHPAREYVGSCPESWSCRCLHVPRHTPLESGECPRNTLPHASCDGSKREREKERMKSDANWCTSYPYNLLNYTMGWYPSRPVLQKCSDRGKTIMQVALHCLFWSTWKWNTVQNSQNESTLTPQDDFSLACKYVLNRQKITSSKPSKWRVGILLCMHIWYVSCLWSEPQHNC